MLSDRAPGSSLHTESSARSSEKPVLLPVVTLEENALEQLVTVGHSMKVKTPSQELPLGATSARSKVKSIKSSDPLHDGH